MKKQFFTLGTAVALAILAPQSRGDDKLKEDPSVRVDKSVKAVGHCDKASGIIGMEVRNRENEKLGEIKDLVLDLETGELSYSVLAVGGFLGLGEKLVALPPGALQKGTDGKFLILNADKAKIQAAPGFAATAWPSANDPEIRQFWREARATGAPAPGERGKSEVDGKKKLYTEPEQDKKADTEVKKD